MWINIKKVWLDFEKIKYFYFNSISNGEWRGHFSFYNNDELYLDFKDKEEANQVCIFLEDIVSKGHSLYKFVKKEQPKEILLKKKKEKLPEGFLSEKKYL